MYQLVAVVGSVNAFDNGEFFQFRGCRHGNASQLARELWIERFPNCLIPCARTLVVQNLRDHGTLKPATHDRGRDRTEKILQSEEQILQRVEEEPHISTRRLAAEVGVSHFVVHPTVKNKTYIHTTSKKYKLGAR